VLKVVFLAICKKSENNEIKPNSRIEKVRIRFKISQHYRDAELLKSLIKYFYCGYYYPRSNQNVWDFVVRKFSDVNEKILPFFAKYPVEVLRI
jgi:hypothetical protein